MAQKPSLCVLLVEDHADTLAAMARLLIKQGYTVHSARTAEEALKLISDNRCDLLISDLALPGASGLDLMRQIKSQYGLPGIAVSGYAADGDVQKALEAGFSRHIAKPLIFQDLIDAIDEVMQAP